VPDQEGGRDGGRLHRDPQDPASTSPRSPLPAGLLDDPGAISPDGRLVALVSATQSGARTLHLVDLGTGADRLLTIPPAGGRLGDTVAWSPDSSFLFVLGAAGDLSVLDAATGEPQELGVPLPAMTQLAIRTAQG
jgi:WD40 repeat protein